MRQIVEDIVKAMQAVESPTPSPLPWMFTKDAWLRDAEETAIAACVGNTFERYKADAELICRAVNAHAALVEALKQIRAMSGCKNAQTYVNQSVYPQGDFVSRAASNAKFEKFGLQIYELAVAALALAEET